MQLKTAMILALGTTLSATIAQADEAGFSEDLSNTLEGDVVCYLTEGDNTPYIVDNTTGETVTLPDGVNLSFQIDETLPDVPENSARLGYCDITAANGDMNAVPLIEGQNLSNGEHNMDRSPNGLPEGFLEWYRDNRPGFDV